MNRWARITILSLAAATLAACSPEPNHACRTSDDCRSGRVCSAGICLPPPEDAGPVDGVADGRSDLEVAIDQRGDSGAEAVDVRDARSDGLSNDHPSLDVPEPDVVPPDAPAADATQDPIDGVRPEIGRELDAAADAPTGPGAIDAYPTDRAIDIPFVSSSLVDAADAWLDASADRAPDQSDALDSPRSLDSLGTGGSGGASSTGGSSLAGGSTGFGGMGGSGSLGGNASSGGSGGTPQTGGATAGVDAAVSDSAIEDAGTTDVGTADASDAEFHPVVEFLLPMPNSDPCGIIKGPDNNLWFGECATGRKIVGRITTSGDIREYAAPEFSDPRVLAAGPDGNIWFVSNSWSYWDWISLGRLAPDSAEMTPFPVLDNDPNAPVSSVGQISALGAGPDNNLWLITGSNDTVGKMTMSGVCTLYMFDLSQTPTKTIIAGPDNHVWFTSAGYLGRVTSTGTLDIFPTTPYPNPPGAAYMTLGGDGRWWISFWQDGINNYQNTMGVMTLAGEYSDFKVSESTGDGGIGPMAKGSDGNIWFANNDAFLRITPEGKVTRFPLTIPGTYVTELATGPDGNIWFVDNGTNSIGRLTVQP